MSLLARLRASPFWPMLRKEFVQMRRDRLTLALMVGVPAIQLLLFGFAIQTEVRNLPTLVLDESRTSESRALIAALENTDNFKLRPEPARSRAEVERAIVAGRARAAVVIPPTYARDLKRGRGAQAQVLVDASDPLASSGAIGGAQQAGMARAQALLPAAVVRAAPVTVVVRPLFNPTLRSSVYIVPGIVGVLLSVTLIIIMSIAVVRERERGTLEQLIVTPITRTSLMLGKVVPFILVGYVQVTVILLLGRVVFDVPMRGSLLLLYAATLPFIFASLAIGLLVSTLVATQAQAMQLGFLFLLPNILLSGFMFPREAMPPPAQWIGAAIPLTHYLEILRGVLLRDAGLWAVWRQIGILTAFAAGFLVLAVQRFHKTMD
ncbi:MAG TPA: ABC transporter permease [Gemmatimonadales bacterium]|nr:ABC transporter permease [Gemmatimonadales bacterium]